MCVLTERGAALSEEVAVIWGRESFQIAAPKFGTHLQELRHDPTPLTWPQVPGRAGWPLYAVKDFRGRWGGRIRSDLIALVRRGTRPANRPRVGNPLSCLCLNWIDGFGRR
ncbi:hypothetical protein SBA4_3730010 [Candidatus Sulfopaludibacter sp. SbA4]|nr:hypothetical protein SBA4_3730010 [Candidatus Sulfopaludibacter sp. SbA4]